MRKQLEEWLLRLAGTSGAMTAGIDNIRKGRYDIAAEAFADAERLYRKHGAPAKRIAEAIAYRAWCLAKLGRAGDAIPLYQEAVDLEIASGSGPERIGQLREHLQWAISKNTTWSESPPIDPNDFHR